MKLLCGEIIKDLLGEQTNVSGFSTLFFVDIFMAYATDVAHTY